MIDLHIINSEESGEVPFTRDQIADFLYEHLDEFGDAREHILASIAYAYGEENGQDGFVLVASDGKQLVGAVVINDTNMGGYIPEHILVYIATHGDYRGQGVGSRMMERILERTEGDVALHVEHDNPARHLYEKYDFTNKYLEYRHSK
ncbi:MAG: GNAT family N-acetyltransferase [Balneolaceae bacterium]|nr:GNAT family N-acetyltransferase [Balneolaceae bacterium]